MSNENNPTIASNNKNSNNNNSPKNKNGGSEGSFVQIFSVVVVIYLFFSLISPMLLKQEQQPRKIETPDILLIALVLLFNSGLTNRLMDLEISKEGSLKAKFKKLEDLERQVGSLSESIDELLLGTVLDAFEYVTLEDLKDEIDIEFNINRSGYALLERLRNRGLIEDTNRVLDDRTERKIQLKESFFITNLGLKYLDLVDKKKTISPKLREIWYRYSDSHSREVRLKLRQQLIYPKSNA